MPIRAYVLEKHDIFQNNYFLQGYKPICLYREELQAPEPMSGL